MKKCKILTHLVMIALLVNLVACGTLLYPERKGMQSGKVDPLVAGLDAVGLLFYIIPGVIAFVVDYNNGTIYLPHGKSSSADGDVKIVKSQQVIDDAYVEQVLREQLDVKANLEASAVISKPVTSLQSVEKQIALY